MLRRPAGRNLRRRLDAEETASRRVHVALWHLWMPWVQHARSGRVVRHGAFLRARCSLQFCRVNFCATRTRQTSHGLTASGGGGGAPSWTFRASGVLLRNQRAHAPLTAKSPLPFPVGRRWHQLYPTSRRLPIALRDDAASYFEIAFDPPDAWLNAATSRRLWRASFSRTLCT